MANYDNPNGFRWVKSLVGSANTPEIVTMKLAASQTIAIGDALTVSSGFVAIATSSSGTILGVADSSCTSSAEGDPIMVIPATPWNVFEAQCSGTYSAAIRFTDVDIEGTTGIMEVNENTTTEKVFHVIGESGDYNNSIGANTRVLGIFKKSAYLGFEAAEA